MMPLSFEIHHAAADGFHIARFYDEVEREAAVLAYKVNQMQFEEDSNL